jgi:hypothetical protein
MAKIGEMISTEEAAEIIKSIESANDGFWFPLTTVVFFFGIVIFLLLEFTVRPKKQVIKGMKKMKI